MRNTTAISIRGDRRYVVALNRFIEDKIGKNTGDYIRELVDEAVGSQLDDYLNSLPENVYQHRRTSSKMETVAE